MEGSIFVLSGEELTLPAAEIKALVETYSLGSECESLSRRVVFSTLNDSALISKIEERAAYARFGGEVVSISSASNNLTDELDSSKIEKNKSFAVRSESIDKEICGEIGGMIKRKLQVRVSLDSPDYVFQAEKMEGGKFVLAFSRRGIKEFSWRERRPRARKFFSPSAIYPKLARLLVNLSHVKEGEYFIDPFCGTGSLLIESSLMGMKTVGFDIKKYVARGARQNLQGFSLDFESIIRADSTNPHFPLNRIDGMATDVPYGRVSSTRGKDTAQIVKEFVATVAAELNPDKYLVLMHPSRVALDPGSAFSLSEQHLLYVHRNLTRAISLLKRR